MKIDRSGLQNKLHLAPFVAAAAILALGLALAAVPHPAHAASKKAQAAGAAVFNDKGCQHCHGSDLAGTDRGPDLSTIGKKWHKDRIEQQIREGGNGMPAFGDLLQPDEVKSLVDYLSSKRKPAHKGALSGPSGPPTPSAPAKPSNDDSGD